MKFAEKLKLARTNAGWTQEELSRQLQITCRTVQNYESGNVYPKKRELYHRLAEVFHTDVTYWQTEDEDGALSQKKSMAESEAHLLTKKVSSLFSDGTLKDEELDRMMWNIQNAYWIGKDKNKTCLK